MNQKKKKIKPFFLILNNPFKHIAPSLADGPLTLEIFRKSAAYRC